MDWNLNRVPKKQLPEFQEDIKEQVAKKLLGKISSDPVLLHQEQVLKHLHIFLVPSKLQILELPSASKQPLVRVLNQTVKIARISIQNIYVYARIWNYKNEITALQLRHILHKCHAINIKYLIKPTNPSSILLLLRTLWRNSHCEGLHLIKQDKWGKTGERRGKVDPQDQNLQSCIYTRGSKSNRTCKQRIPKVPSRIPFTYSD